MYGIDDESVMKLNPDHFARGSRGKSKTVFGSKEDSLSPSSLKEQHKQGRRAGISGIHSRHEIQSSTTSDPYKTMNRIHIKDLIKKKVLKRNFAASTEQTASAALPEIPSVCN